MKIFLKSLTVILFSALALGQNLPNIDTGTKGQLPVSRLKAGTSGTQCLFTDSLIVFWSTCASGSGTVTNVSIGNLSPLFTANVTNPTTIPAIAFSLSNAGAHTFFGNTSGSTGPPSYSAITAADLPGVFAANTNATAHQFFTAYNSTTGAFTKAQPDYSDLTGTPVLPSTLANTSHKWFNSYNSITGLFTQTQPDYSDLTGTPTLPVNNVGTAHQFFTAYNSSTGAFSLAQPSTADLSDFPSQATHSGQFLTTNGTVLSWGAPAGAGTVTTFSSGNLSPLFTTSVATPTSTPSQTFALSTAAAHTFFGNNTGATAAPAYEAIGNGDLPGSGAVTLNTTSPLGGGGSVALGSSLTFTCTGCLTSVTAHNLLSATHGDTTTHSVVRGDLIAGIGAVPTWTAVAKGGTNTYPKWNASGDVIPSTLAASGVGSPTSCTNQFVTALTLNADAAPTSTCTTATLASAQYANQGTATTVLHGNAAGNPAFSAVTSADTTGTFPATAHNILSATHGDSTASAAVRGGGIFALGASPTWTQVAHSATTGGYFKWNGTDIVASSLAASGTGNCGANQFETGDNADAAPTCAQPAYAGISGTPAVPTGTGYSHVTSGALDSAAKLVNLTASTDVAANQGTTTTLLHGNAVGQPSFTGVSLTADASANQGTVNQLLHGNAAGQPTFSAVVSADLNITTSTCTNQFVTAISAGGVGTCTTDTLASAQHANQGTTITVLHGNAAGNPSFASVTSADTTGTFPATAHSILSATHSDATTGTVARGDIITGQGASATWARLAKGSLGQCLQMDGSGVDIVWGTCGAGGGVSTVSGTANQITSTGGTTPVLALANPLIFPGEVTYAAATTGAASTNTPSGTAPTTPVAGDYWRDGNGFNFIESTTANGTVDVRSDQAGVIGAANTVRYTADSNIAKTSVNAGALEFNNLSAAALTANQIVLGNGNGETQALGSLGTTTTVLHGNASGLPSFGSIVQGDVTNGYVDLTSAQSSILGLKTFDNVQLSKFNAAAWFDVSGLSGADEGAKFTTCATALPSTGGVCDGGKLTGAQAITTDAFNTTKPVAFLLGAGTHTVSAQINYTSPTTVTVASPSAPTTNTTTTTGGTLSGSVFVDVTYVVGSTRIAGVLGETAGSAELTVSMNAACPGTPTCTATINVPAGLTGATGVNVYESNATGTASKKLCNTFGPLDLGGTYQITANCAGVAMPTSTTAYLGASAIIGEGPNSTILAFTTAGFITCGGCSPLPFNWTFADFSIAQPNGGTGQGKIVAFGGDNLTIKNVEFTGGKDGIYWDGVHNSRILNVRGSEIHDGGSYIFVLNAFSACDHILIDNPVLRGGTVASGSGYTAGILVNGCDNVDINHPQIEAIDFSRAGSAGAVGLSGVHHGSVTGGTISNNINGDGVDVIGNSQTGGASRWSEDITVSGTSISGNTTVGGIGTFHGTADAIGIQEARNITVTGVVGAFVGLNAGTPANRLPCVEVYLSDSVIINGVICHDSAQGVSTNSSTNLELVSFKATNNQRSGLYANRSVSTCTVSSASPNVAWATGQAFGPWPQGTVIVLNGTNKVISSVTDFHNLVLTANAGSTGTFSCGVDTSGKITNSEFDSNGQSGEAGNNNKDGVFLDNSAYFQISNTSMDDAQTAKTQLNGLETATGTAARAVVNGLSGGGGSGVLFLDNVGTSPFIKDDGATLVFTASAINKFGQADIVSSSSAINTTEAIIVKTPALPANRMIAGTHVKIVLEGTCTSTVANTSTFTIRWGTNGTTADGTIAALVSTVAATSGTNNGFRAVIDMVVRVPGSSATSTTFLAIASDGNIGIAATPTAKSVAGTAFNSTTANGILSVAYKSAATTTTSTFTIASIEFTDN